MFYGGKLGFDTWPFTKVVGFFKSAEAINHNPSLDLFHSKLLNITQNS